MKSLNGNSSFGKIFNDDLNILLSNVNEVLANDIRQQILEALYRFSKFYKDNEADVYFGMVLYIWYIEHAHEREESQGKSKSDLLDAAVKFCLYRYKRFWFFPKHSRKKYRELIQKLYLSIHYDKKR
jgi:hypothetical protein